MKSFDDATHVRDGLPYFRVDGTPKLSIDQDHGSAIEEILIRSSDLRGWVAICFPKPTQNEGYQHYHPRRYLDVGAGFFRASSIDLEPVGNLPGHPFSSLHDTETHLATYTQVYKATITYELCRSDDDFDPNKPDTFVDKSVMVGGEFLTIAASKTKTVEAAVYVDEGDETAAKNDNEDRNLVYPKLIPTLEWTTTWKNVLWPPWTTIVNRLGTVNDRTLDMFNSATYETVLFLGGQFRRKWRWFGGDDDETEAWDLEYRFSQRHIYDADGTGETYGWNHVWSGSEQKWVKLLRGDNNDLLYKRQNHLDLFKIETAI